MENLPYTILLEILGRVPISEIGMLAITYHNKLIYEAYIQLYIDNIISHEIVSNEIMEYCLSKVQRERHSITHRMYIYRISFEIYTFVKKYKPHMIDELVFEIGCPLLMSVHLNQFRNDLLEQDILPVLAIDYSMRRGSGFFNDLNNKGIMILIRYKMIIWHNRHIKRLLKIKDKCLRDQTAKMYGMEDEQNIKKYEIKSIGNMVSMNLSDKYISLMLDVFGLDCILKKQQNKYFENLKVIYTKKNMRKYTSSILKTIKLIDYKMKYEELTLLTNVKITDMLKIACYLKESEDAIFFTNTLINKKKYYRDVLKTKNDKYTKVFFYGKPVMCKNSVDECYYDTIEEYNISRLSYSLSVAYYYAMYNNMGYVVDNILKNSEGKHFSVCILNISDLSEDIVVKMIGQNVFGWESIINANTQYLVEKLMIYEEIADALFDTYDPAINTTTNMEFVKKVFEQYKISK